MVEALAAATLAKTSWDSETAEWVGGLDSKLHDRLAKVGLVPKRPEVARLTLKTFLDDYLAKRTDLKPRTRMKLNTTRDRLIEFFGAERPLDSI